MKVFAPCFIRKSRSRKPQSTLMQGIPGLILAYRHLDGIGEEMLAELLCGGHHLIAHHRQMAATRFEGCERLGNTLVRTSGIE